jgi:hypothetical protein
MSESCRLVTLGSFPRKYNDFAGLVNLDSIHVNARRLHAFHGAGNISGTENTGAARHCRRSRFQYALDVIRSALSPKSAKGSVISARVLRTSSSRMQQSIPPGLHRLV